MTGNDREQASAMNDQESNPPVEDLKAQDVDPSSAEKVKGGLIPGLVQPVALISMSGGSSSLGTTTVVGTTASGTGNVAK